MAAWAQQIQVAIGGVFCGAACMVIALAITGKAGATEAARGLTPDHNQVSAQASAPSR